MYAPRSDINITNMGSNSQNVSSKLFYNVKDVASQFGISTKTVYRLLDRGQLRASPALRRKLIPKASVESFIAASLQGGAR